MSSDVIDDALSQTGSYVSRALRLFDSYGDREAVVGGGRRLTYREVRGLVVDLAGVLQRHGIGAGAGVLVLAGNTVELPALQLALHLLGARTMWIAPIAGRSEIEQFAALSEPDVFLYDAAGKAELGERLATQLGVTVLCLGPGGLGPDVLSGQAADLEPRPTGDLATCLQTSGTTGIPKLVHHGREFYEQILTLGADFVAAGNPLLRHLSHSPMAFASGQITGLFNLNVGAGPAAPSRLRQAIVAFGPCLRIVYGLSEVIVVTAQPGLTEDPEHPERLRSSGTPYGDVRLQTRDASGTALPPGETGEIWAASRLAFKGYWGQPELTARTIVDGWVRTGKANWNVYCRP